MSTCDCTNQDSRANCCRLKAALAERDEARALCEIAQAERNSIGVEIRREWIAKCDAVAKEHKDYGVARDAHDAVLKELLALREQVAAITSIESKAMKDALLAELNKVTICAQPAATGERVVKMPPRRYLKDRAKGDDTFSDFAQGFDEALDKVESVLAKAGIAVVQK